MLRNGVISNSIYLGENILRIAMNQDDKARTIDLPNCRDLVIEIITEFLAEICDTLLTNECNKRLINYLACRPGKNRLRIVAGLYDIEVITYDQQYSVRLNKICEADR